MLRKFIKDIVKECVQEVTNEEKRTYTLNTQSLLRDTVNVVYVPVGNLTKSKIETYLKEIQAKFDVKNPQYNVVLIPIKL